MSRSVFAKIRRSFAGVRPSGSAHHFSHAAHTGPCKTLCKKERPPCAVPLDCSASLFSGPHCGPADTYRGAIRNTITYRLTGRSIQAKPLAAGESGLFEEKKAPAGMCFLFCFTTSLLSGGGSHCAECHAHACDEHERARRGVPLGDWLP